MGHLRRYGEDVTRLLIAVLLIRAVTFAQGFDERQRAEELLSSTSLTSRAWGAYLAGHLHLAQLDDLLCERLAEAQIYRDWDFDSEEHAYVLALFDALIESGQKVPTDILIPFKENSRDEVLILMARDAGNEDLLLAMREEKLDEAQWLTVNNLLLRLRSARLFVKTLEELRITHKFTVVDHDGIGFGDGSGYGGVSDGIRQLPKHFPPIGLYQLIVYAGEGYVLVAKGPRDVYYRRTVVPTNHQAGWGIPFSSWDDQQERLEYLAALNQMTVEQTKQVFWAGSVIRWRDLADFSSGVDSDLGGQAAGIQAFVSKAKQRGLAGLAGVTLKIIPEVADQRRNVTVVLPAEAPKEFVLQ